MFQKPYMQTNPLSCNHNIRFVRDKVTCHCHISIILPVSSMYVYLCFLEIIKVIYFEIISGCIYRQTLNLSKYVYIVCINFRWFQLIYSPMNIKIALILSYMRKMLCIIINHSHLCCMRRSDYAY